MTPDQYEAEIKNLHAFILQVSQRLFLASEVIAKNALKKSGSIDMDNICRKMNELADVEASASSAQPALTERAMSEVNPIPTHWKFQDLTGHKFGRLIVVSFAYKRYACSHWNCLCECGGTAVCRSSSLKDGYSQSCGCIIRKHGKTRTSEYNIWSSMIARCTNRKCHAYHRYGGRGITVCERWRTSFINFFSDMGPRPSLKYTLDRFPDNDGNYEPGNCRWATMKEQQRNRGNNHLITINGQTKCLNEWAEIVGLHRTAIERRIKKGMNEIDAVMKPNIRPGHHRGAKT